MKDTLKMSDDDIKSTTIKHAQRIGRIISGKPKNTLAVFDIIAHKSAVRECRTNLESDSGFSMFDQYPSHIVAQRNKLVPIMKKVRGDDQEAYIKYN